MGRTVEDVRPTLVILTALPVEYEAVRERLTGCEPLVHPSGTRVERGRLAGTEWHVALAQIGEGNQTAAIVTERLSTWLSPQALFFVGVAGGLKEEIRIGDVVVGTRVYAYHGGKQTPEGFYARPRAWDASHRLEQTARYALGGPRWRDRVHFKPIAAGEVVLNDADSDLADQIRRHYNDAVAIEMESAGVAHAAHLVGALDTLTIRGISDKADGAKHLADASGSQPLAAATAAQAAMAIIAELEPTVRRNAPDQREPSAPSVRYGGDHIDFRGGTFYGPVTGKVVRGPEVPGADR
ncbi:5'-methylthioadenosine/S-adenosylhomocysteine nucleosidase [Streptomyces sp. NPDC017958]|uniref:5'-methylthioadenosine/S-adenosylhomocysteine nucleosidase n=1 Tax=Streptomyces sp. NPDC017958 TaxID=3365021 RepID=UPI003790ED6A